MKFYEGLGGSDTRLMPLVPVMARLDGVAFHTFTKGLRRPYDERLSNLMVETTKFLVEETNARCGYTQSDEITLVWLTDSIESQIYRDGRLFKMVSILPAKATAFFNRNLKDYLPEKANLDPVFDCRVWNVPNRIEAANVFLWRELDATKNSVSMAAQHYFSHKELQNKHSGEMQEMLFQKHGINWNDYPTFFRRGTYIQRKKVERAFTTDELDRLPAQHEARRNPDLKVVRSVYDKIDLPPLLRIANRVEVIFDGAAPVSLAEKETLDEQSL